MDDLRHIERALMAYWTGNPEAADSLEGIARWWIPSAAPDKVAVVLDRLVQRGTVYVVSTPTHNRVLYKLVH